MKYKILILLFLYATSVFSQKSNDLIIYLDSLGNATIQKNHRYKRIIEDFYTEKQLYAINDYYKSGSIRMKSISDSKYYFSPIETITTYYENGNKSSLQNISKLNPINKEFYWYENGKIKFELETSFNDVNQAKTYRVLQYWDKNNNQRVVDGNGEFEDDDKMEYTKGNYINGKKEGIWIGLNKTYNFTFTEKYKDDEFISGTSTDSNKMEHNYTIQYEFPKPKQGLESLNQRIDQFCSHYRNKHGLVYEPSKSIIVDIKPLKKVTIKINIDGSSEIESIEGIDDESDKKRLITILNKYKEWNPYVRRGIIIPYSYPLFLPLLYND